MSMKFFWQRASYLTLHHKKLRDYIYLCSRKKGHFYDFFLEKQHNFFLQTERLFIMTFKQNFCLAPKTESSDVQKLNFLEKRSPFL